MQLNLEKKYGDDNKILLPLIRSFPAYHKPYQIRIEPCGTAVPMRLSKIHRGYVLISSKYVILKHFENPFTVRKRHGTNYIDKHLN